MNTASKILLGSVLLASSGVSMAECPQNLNAKQMYDCIVVEGAGDIYEPPKAADDKTVQTTDTTTSDDNKHVKLAKNNAKN